MIENEIGRACDAADPMAETMTSDPDLNIGAEDEAPSARVPLFEWRKAIASSDLSSTQRVVCHTLGLHMDKSGGSCFPSTPLIAGESGCTKRTVEIALSAIEAAGYVRRRRGGEHGRGDKSTYEATVPLSERAKQLRCSVPTKGEADSPIGDVKGRSSFAERANLTREKGEADSPEVVRRTTVGRPPRDAIDVNDPRHPGYVL